MWGYKDFNGPAKWMSIAMDAAGYNQSPVRIERAKVKYDESLKVKELKLLYDKNTTKTLQNTGASISVSFDDTKSKLTGGPLSVDYTLKQFHFHWGSKSEVGAEHLIDDIVYSAELHFVHWNSTTYSTMEEAVKAKDGIAVLTVFLKKGKEHPALKVLTDLYPKVAHSGDKVTLPDGFDLLNLLPKNRERYWTYNGSLTTPPCYESVQFIIYEEPIEVSEEQLNAFRALKICKKVECPDPGKCQTECCMMDNFRPIMPLNDRVVRASFKSDINANE